LVEDRYEKVKNRYRKPGDAIEGDKIIIYCRKKDKWESNIRASDTHHYFRTIARKNALAIIDRTFKNLQR